MARGLLKDTVILSDDSGQFNVGLHALCWIHAERLVHKLDAFADWQRKAKDRIQSRIWRLYANLKAYCCDPKPELKRVLVAHFNRIFTSPQATRHLIACWLGCMPNRIADGPEAPGNPTSQQRHRE